VCRYDSDLNLAGQIKVVQDMDYSGLVDLVGESRWQVLSDKLVDIILTTKNDEKMPSGLARRFLHLWQQDHLASKTGLAVLLEAGARVEPEKVLSTLSELNLEVLESKIKEDLSK
jgi:hypothetical protein